MWHYRQMTRILWKPQKEINNSVWWTELYLLPYLIYTVINLEDLQTVPTDSLIISFTLYTCVKRGNLEIFPLKQLTIPIRSLIVWVTYKFFKTLQYS